MPFDRTGYILTYCDIQEGGPMIEFRNVTKSYGDNIGLSDINITIDDGEFVFLVGPSGAGKSTFIKLILKEIDPDCGHIYFEGRDITQLPKRLIPALRRDLGIVFQDFRLLPKKTVYENVAFAMEAVHQRKRLIYKQVPHILKLVGISEQAERYPMNFPEVRRSGWPLRGRLSIIRRF